MFGFTTGVILKFQSEHRIQMGANPILISKNGFEKLKIINNNLLTQQLFKRLC